jgi:hypothetical protein
MYYVTLRKAGKRLRKPGHKSMSPSYLKGLAEGLGLRLVPIGTALCLSEADFKRLAESVLGKIVDEVVA